MGVNGIYGLSGSGLDIDSMVKVGMMSKQNQLDKMQQTYTKNEWKKEALLDIYKKVEDFNLKKMTDYKLSSNLSSRSATSSDSNLTAEANADASIGPHYITVTKTATNAYLVGTKNSYTLNGSETSLVKAGAKDLKTLAGLEDNEKFSLTINNKPINLDGSKTLYELVSAVNAETSSTGVKMTYDNDNGYISFFQKNLGATDDEGNAINISIKANNTETAQFLTNLGLKNREKANDNTYTSETFSSGTAVTASGQNAEVNIDGKVITANKNRVFSDGVTYNIGNVTTNQQITVNVDQDPEKIVETVKSFVDDYNELLDSIYDAYRESPNSSYKPLTDAQKSAMTEDQIKKWEEKAKSGMLYHDQTLRKIIDDLRNSVTDEISGAGKYNSIFSIGIKTTGLYGQLTLDETKLRDALTDDSDAVYNVFAKNGTNNASNGIANRLSTALNDATKSISSVSGKDSSTSGDSTLDTLLRSMQERISNFKKTMKTYEDNLYKRYDAMESALASLGSQMNYVSSMFSS